MAFIIAFVAFIVVASLCLLVWFSFGSDSHQEQIQRRLDAVQRAERRGPVDLGVQLVRDEMWSSVPALNRIVLRWAWSSRFRDFVMQAGMKTRPGKVLMTCAALAGVAFIFVTPFFSF